MRVLRECNSESFYQRCLPLGVLFGSAGYVGTKSGKLYPFSLPSPHAKPDVCNSRILQSKPEVRRGSQNNRRSSPGVLCRKVFVPGKVHGEVLTTAQQSDRGHDTKAAPGRMSRNVKSNLWRCLTTCF